MGARRFQRATLLIKPMDGGMQVILGGVDLSARDFAALADAAARALQLRPTPARGVLVLPDAAVDAALAAVNPEPRQ